MHNDLIGKPWGSQVFSHMGSPFFVLQPSLADLLRGNQAKHADHLSKRYRIYPGANGYWTRYKVGEAGTGSGALTTAIAFYVGDEGKIYTYEQKEENIHLAQKNLQKVGLENRVVFHHREIKDGFLQTDLDAVFLDMNNPFDYMGQVRQALKPGGFFGCILPTANQVCKLLDALRQERFAFVDVLEIAMRFYKAEPERIPPGGSDGCSYRLPDLRSSGGLRGRGRY